MHKTAISDRMATRLLAAYFGFIVTFVVTMTAGYITHVVALFNAVNADEINTIGKGVFWVCTTLLVPLGSFHGIYLWF